MKSTKKSFIGALVALVICFAMLVGSTLAWFTDSASVGIQTITTGELDLIIEDAEGTDLDGTTLTWQKKNASAGDPVWWEPGATYETKEFYIVNDGNLSFQFQIALNEMIGDLDLLNVITFDIVAEADDLLFNLDGEVVSATAGSKLDLLEGITVGGVVMKDYIVLPQTKVGPLKVVAHMAESAGNEYMNKKLDGIGFTVLASQAIVEYDSNGNEYDDNKGRLAFVEDKETLVSELNKGSTVVLNRSFDVDDYIYLKDNAVIYGNGKTVSGAKLVMGENSKVQDLTFVGATEGTDESYVYIWDVSATVDNCTFDSPEWDAIQATTTVNDVTFTITNNTFKNTLGLALRYVHVEITDIDLRKASDNNVKAIIDNNTFELIDTCDDDGITVAGLLEANVSFNGNNATAKNVTKGLSERWFGYVENSAWTMFYPEFASIIEVATPYTINGVTVLLSEKAYQSIVYHDRAAYADKVKSITVYTKQDLDSAMELWNKGVYIRNGQNDIHAELHFGADIDYLGEEFHGFDEGQTKGIDIYGHGKALSNVKFVANKDGKAGLIPYAGDMIITALTIKDAVAEGAQAGIFAGNTSNLVLNACKLAGDITVKYVDSAVEDYNGIGYFFGVHAEDISTLRVSHKDANITLITDGITYPGAFVPTADKLVGVVYGGSYNNEGLSTTSSELKNAINSANGETVYLGDDITWDSNFDKETKVDLAGNEIELKESTYVSSQTDLTVKDSISMTGGTLDASKGYLDCRPTDEAYFEFKDMEFKATQYKKTIGTSTTRVGYAMKLNLTASGINTTYVFEDCTFENAKVFFGGISGTSNSFTAKFINCTFNNFGDGAIEVQNYLSGSSIIIKDCTFNITATSGEKIISTMSDITATFEGENFVNGVEAVPTNDPSLVGTPDEIKVHIMSVKLADTKVVVSGKDTVTVSGIATK